MGRIYKGIIVVFSCLLLVGAAIYRFIPEKIKEVDVKTTKRIALTFDDGPGKYTQDLLLGLKERNVKATFFLVGENIEKYKDIVKKMNEDGNIIGNHTYSHIDMCKVNSSNVDKEVLSVNKMINEITNKEPIYIRPPYGKLNKSLSGLENMTEVLWNIDPLDWYTKNTESVVKHVISHAKDGGIIIMHDIYKTSVAAAFIIIDTLKEQGYEFVTIDEMKDMCKNGVIR